MTTEAEEVGEGGAAWAVVDAEAEAEEDPSSVAPEVLVVGVLGESGELVLYCCCCEEDVEVGAAGA